MMAATTSAPALGATLRTAARRSHAARPLARTTLVVRAMTKPVTKQKDGFGAGFQLGGLQKLFGFGMPTSGGQHAYNAQTCREDYDVDDVKLYWDVSGLLAVETNYDRMDAMLATGMQHIDVMLLLAAESNDMPTLQELLDAGADVTVQDAQGRKPVDLATLKEARAMLEAAAHQPAR